MSEQHRRRNAIRIVVPLVALFFTALLGHPLAHAAAMQDAAFGHTHMPGMQPTMHGMAMSSMRAGMTGVPRAVASPLHGHTLLCPSIDSVLPQRPAIDAGAGLLAMH